MGNSIESLTIRQTSKNDLSHIKPKGDLHGREVAPVSHGDEGCALAIAACTVSHCIITLIILGAASGFMASNILGLNIAGYVLLGVGALSALVNLCEGACVTVLSDS